ncbi:MAG: acetaldehyde dehydrogenase (acetylating) [Clostridia bacterium]|nr:acetaldehyde dehydrogenase (acetylating) [Clostridia bacterium]
MVLDRDLQSIQEVRNLVAASSAAQKEYGTYAQQRIDGIVAAVARACAEMAEPLAKMAAEETGFGNPADKTVKNLRGSTMTYDYIRDMRTVGILNEDREAGITEIGVPMGVIAAIIPSTNPTSTVMYKSLICLKSGNGVVISPHPSAKKCIQATVDVVIRAAVAAGAPEGLIGCISTPTMEASQALMQHRGIALILATGGEAMVRAAYSSGNPALGVGPGNGPAYIERSADIERAIRHIFDSKTFDYGTICASEQSIVTEACISGRVIAAAEAQGGYFLNGEESRQVGKFLLRANGTMNPAIVGKPALKIAEMAGIRVPQGTRVLLSVQTEVSRDNPYSREKLCPVLGFYVEEDWESACERCIAILENEGAGHTMTIHSENEDVIREFALKKPVNRLLVNTPGALGGVGATTSLPPALTLGCGAVGKSATSDNVGPRNLVNIRRVARGRKELEALRGAVPAASAPGIRTATGSAGPDMTKAQIEAIVQAVLARING